MTSQVLPLEGVRVIEFVHMVMGPTCGMVLGDLGADVIKIEPPGRGDDTRAWGPPFLPRRPDADPEKAGQSAYYLCCNRSKRSLAIDIATKQGAALVRDLAAKADIFVENFRVGGLAKYGLDYASLARINPRLVYCSITGFGQSGPYARRGGYDFVAQAMGGLMSVTGQPEGTPGAEPLKTGVAICDLFTGMYAAVAILAALRHAEKTGQGQYIDCALLDAQVAMLANQASSHLVAGVVPKPMGNAHPTIVPYRTFQAKDGPLVIACGNDGQFNALCRALGRLDLAQDERYRRNSDRIAARGELEDDLARTIARRGVEDLTQALVEAGVPAGPINTLDKVFADPQVKFRHVVRTFEREDGVGVPIVAFPPKLSVTPADYRQPPPDVGEHTGEALRDWLGLDDAAIAALANDKIIGV